MKIDSTKHSSPDKTQAPFKAPNSNTKNNNSSTGNNNIIRPKKHTSYISTSSSTVTNPNTKTLLTQNA